MNAYLERKVLESEPIELVRILHQIAISAVQDARRYLATRKIAERAQAITRAYGAVAELGLSLRPEAAPELAKNLLALYAYIQSGLIEANFSQKDEPLEEALGLLNTLRDGWDGVSTEHSTESAPQTGYLDPRSSPAKAGATTAGL